MLNKQAEDRLQEIVIEREAMFPTFNKWSYKWPK